MDRISQLTDASSGELTKEVFNDLLDNLGEDGRFNPNNIATAIELDSRLVFLEGVVKRLNELGFECCIRDTEKILSEINRRFREVLGFKCPRTIQEWIKGTTPSVSEGKTNGKKNNYDLCYALEMNLEDTAEFFVKHYLTLPFNYKNRIDAIFFYCLYHKHPYSVVKRLLDASDGLGSAAVEKEAEIHTSTRQIALHITQIASVEEFLDYLSRHCYGNEQQYHLARTKIQELASKHSFESYADLHNQLMGFYYQNIKREKWKKVENLPKRFIESLPTDGVLSNVLTGEYETYETLRKTLIILKLFDFYLISGRGNCDEQAIWQNSFDFEDEANKLLAECGFSQLYMRHPFDLLIMLCSYSSDPIDSFLDLSEMRYQESI